MKILLFVTGLLAMISCNNSGTKEVETADSPTINTTNSNAADGGPNHGLGDTNTYNRANDTVTKADSLK